MEKLQNMKMYTSEILSTIMGFELDKINPIYVAIEPYQYESHFIAGRYNVYAITLNSTKDDVETVVWSMTGIPEFLSKIILEVLELTEVLEEETPVVEEEEVNLPKKNTPSEKDKLGYISKILLQRVLPALNSIEDRLQDLEGKGGAN